MQTDNRKLNTNELNTTELDAVSGGMKWTRGTCNADVIDARGGQHSFMGLHWTVNGSGNVSSWSIG